MADQEVTYIPKVANGCEIKADVHALMDSPTLMAVMWIDGGSSVFRHTSIDRLEMCRQVLSLL